MIKKIKTLISIMLVISQVLTCNAFFVMAKDFKMLMHVEEIKTNQNYMEEVASNEEEQKNVSTVEVEIVEKESTKHSDDVSNSSDKVEVVSEEESNETKDKDVSDEHTDNEITNDLNNEDKESDKASEKIENDTLTEEAVNVVNDVENNSNEENSETQEVTQEPEFSFDDEEIVHNEDSDKSNKENVEEKNNNHELLGGELLDEQKGLGIASQFGQQWLGGRGFHYHYYRFGGVFADKRKEDRSKIEVNGKTGEGWYQESDGYHKNCISNRTNLANKIPDTVFYDVVESMILFNEDNVIGEIDENITKPGYKFAGWYTDSKYKYKLTDVSNHGYDGPNLYAKWVEDGIFTYKVVYHLDEGATLVNGTAVDNVYTVSDIDNHNVYNLLTSKDVKKDGYSLKGWRIGGKAEEHYFSSDIVYNKFEAGRIVLDTIDVYPEWVKPTYTIEYFVLDDENVTSSTYSINKQKDTLGKKRKYFVETEVPVNETKVLPTDLTNGNKIFNWYKHSKTTTDENHKPVYLFENGPWLEIPKDTAKIGETVTLFAVWTDKYKVNYNLNGGQILGETIKDDIYVVKDIDISSDYELIDKPIKPGFVLEGWYEDKECTKKITSIPKNSMKQVYKDVYAKWEKSNTRIKYVLDGGSLENVTLDSDGNYVFDLDLSKPYTMIQNATKKGFLFDGWYNQDFTEKITEVKEEDIVNGEIVVYAKWETGKYAIVVDINADDAYRALTEDSSENHFVKNYADDSQYEHITTNTWTYKDVDSTKIFDINSNIKLYRKGWTFLGWTDESGAPITEIKDFAVLDGNEIKIKAKWQIIEYSIKYVLNEGSIANKTIKNDTYRILEKFEKIEKDYQLLNAESLSKTGYKFASWHLNKDLSDDGRDTIDIDVFLENDSYEVVLYAEWTEEEYEINYELDEGDFVEGYNPTRIRKYTEGAELPTKDDVAKKGYTFIGWFGKDTKKGSTYTEVTEKTVGNKTFYAGWFQNKYIIKAHLDFGKLVGATIPSQMPVGEASVLPTADQVVKDGWTFVGWYTNKDLTQGPVTEINSETVSQIDIYAKFVKPTITLTFVVGDEASFVEGANVPKEYENGTHLILPTAEDITKDGWTFDGWYEDEGYLGNRVYSLNANYDSEKTFYAKWNRILNAPINYELYGGQFVSTYEEPKFYLNETVTLATSDEVVKVGHDFLGWYNNSTFSGEPITTIDEYNKNGYNLFAKWQPKKVTIKYELGENGSFIEQVTEECLFGDTITLPKQTSVKARYQDALEGWYLDKDYLTERLGDVITADKEEIVLYAKWYNRFSGTKITVQYEIPKIFEEHQRGIVEERRTLPVNGTDISNQTIVYDAKNNIYGPINLPTEKNLWVDGYHLVGFKQVTGTQANYSAVAYSLEELQYYAELYEEGTAEYTYYNDLLQYVAVNYLAINSKSYPDYYMYTYDDTTPSPTNFYENLIYKPGQSISFDNTTVSSGDVIKLRPIWKPNKYTINFALGENAEGTVPDSITNIETDQLVTLPNITDESIKYLGENYHLAGWKVVSAVDGNGFDVMSEIKKKEYELGYNGFVSFPSKDNGVITISPIWQYRVVHTHKECGIKGDCHHYDSSEHTLDIEFEAISTFEELLQLIEDTETNGKTSCAVYLTDDVVYHSDFVINRDIDIYICLNGHNLTTGSIISNKLVDRDSKAKSVHITNCSDNNVTYTHDSATGIPMIYNAGVVMASETSRINVVTDGQFIYNNALDREIALYNVDVTSNNSLEKENFVYMGSGHNLSVVNTSFADINSVETLINIKQSHKRDEKTEFNNVAIENVNGKAKYLLNFDPDTTTNNTFEITNLSITNSSFAESAIYVGKDAVVKVDGKNEIVDNSTNNSILYNEGTFELVKASSLDIKFNNINKNRKGIAGVVLTNEKPFDVYGNLTITDNSLKLTDEYYNDDSDVVNYNAAVALLANKSINVGQGTIIINKNNSDEESEEGKLYEVYANIDETPAFVQEEGSGKIDPDSDIGVVQGEGTVYKDENEENDPNTKDIFEIAGDETEQENFTVDTNTDDNGEIIVRRKLYIVEFEEGEATSRSKRSYPIWIEGELDSSETKVRVTDLKSGKEFVYDATVKEECGEYAAEGFSIIGYKIPGTNDVLNVTATMSFIVKEDGEVIKLVTQWQENKIPTNPKEIKITTNDYVDMVNNSVADALGDDTVDNVKGSDTTVKVNGEYIIEYHLDGGVIIPTLLTHEEVYQQTVKLDKSFKLYDNPTKENYIFDGWYGDDGYNGMPITEVKGEKEGQVIPVFAKWIDNTYKITYHLEGGEIIGKTAKDDVYEETKLKGYLYYLPDDDDIIKAGKIFDGWYEKDENGELVGKPVTNVPKTNNEDKEYWAKYIDETFEVIFHLEGGKMEGVEGNEWKVVADRRDPFKKLPKVTKENYEFISWADESLERYYYFYFEADRAEAEGEENHVYAKWLKSGYEVIYHLDGGKVSDEENIDTETDTYREGEKTYETHYLNNSITKEGYRFLGWYLDPEIHKGEKIFSNSVRSIDGKDYEVWPLFIQNTYELTFHLNGGQISGVEPEESEDGGINKVTVNTKFDYLFPLAEKKGYVFEGWVDKDDNPLYGGRANDTNFVTDVYAKYSEYPNGKLIYHLEGGELKGEDANAVNNGVLAKTIEPFEVTPLIRDIQKDNYVFAGWYKKDKNNKYVGNPIFYTVFNNYDTELEVWAKWTEFNSSAQQKNSIKFHLDGGHIDGRQSENDITTIDYVISKEAKEETILLYDAYKKGAKFEGWFKTAECTGDKEEMFFTFDKTAPTTDLYAKWSDTRVTLNYNLHEGTMRNKFVTDEVFSVSFDEWIDAYLEEPTRDGYDFLGWYEDETWTSPVTYDGFTDWVRDRVGEYNLHAKWIKRYFNVNYHIDGGKFVKYVLTDIKNGVMTQEINNAHSYSLLLSNEIYKDGFQFEEWQDADGNKIEVIFNDTMTEDIDVYAKWKAISFPITYHLDGGHFNYEELSHITDTYVKKSVNVGITHLMTNVVKDGFKFVGWYGNAQFTGDKVTTVPKDNIDPVEVWAKYETSKFKLTYHLDEGGKINNNTFENDIYEVNIDRSKDSSLIAKSSVTRGDVYRDTFTGRLVPEWTFLGWYRDKECTDGPVTYLSELKKGDDYLRDVYAKWENDKYNVVFNTDGGEILVNGAISSNEGAVSSRARAYVLPTTVYKENHKFLGWYFDKDCNDGPYIAIPTDSVVGTTKQVYAKYEQISFNLTYHLDGGQIEELNADGDTCVVEVSLDDYYVLEKLEKDGCDFLGWWTDEKCEEEQIVMIDRNSQDITDVYAKLVESSEETQKLAEEYEALRLATLESVLQDNIDYKTAKAVDERKKITEQYTFGTNNWLNTIMNSQIKSSGALSGSVNDAMMNLINKKLNESNSSNIVSNDTNTLLLGSSEENLLGDENITITQSDLYAHDILTPELLGIDVEDGYDLSAYMITSVTDSKGNPITNSALLGYVPTPDENGDIEVMDLILLIASSGEDVGSIGLSAITFDKAIYDITTEDITSVPLTSKTEEGTATDGTTTDPSTDPSTDISVPDSSNNNNSSNTNTKRKPTNNGIAPGGGNNGGVLANKQQDNNSNIVVVLDDDNYSNPIVKVGNGLVNQYGHSGRGNDNGAFKSLFASKDIMSALMNIKNYNTIDLSKIKQEELKQLGAGYFEYYPASNGYKYFYMINNNKTYAKNGWLQLNTDKGAKWFRFDNDGMMMRGFVSDNDKIYYLRNSLDGVAYMMTGFVEFKDSGLISHFNDSGELDFVFPKTEKANYIDSKAALPTNALNKDYVRKLMKIDKSSNVITKTIKTTGSTSVGNFVGYWYYLKDGRRKFRFETIDNNLIMSQFAKQGWINAFDKTGKENSYKFDSKGNLVINNITEEGLTVGADGVIVDKTTGITKLSIGITSNKTTLKGIELANASDVTLDINNNKSSEVSEYGIMSNNSKATNLFTTTNLVDEIVALNQTEE